MDTNRLDKIDTNVSSNEVNDLRFEEHALIEFYCSLLVLKPETPKSYFSTYREELKRWWDDSSEEWR